MEKRMRVLLGLSLGLLLAASPAAAQDYRYAASWNVGGAWFSPLNAGGAGAASAVTDIQLDPGWIAGVQFEEWFGSGRAGFRVNGALSQRPLKLPGESRDIGLWLADADLMLRLLPATPERYVNAFISGGAGVVKYGLGSGRFLAYEDADAVYGGGKSARLAVAGGFGIDVVTSLRWDDDPVGFRIEIVDHMVVKSPFTSISGGDFDPVHNVRLVIGVFTGWGLHD
jgi:hypothetical protein